MIFDNKKNRIMYLFIPCLDITAIFLKFDLINNKVHHILKTQISQPIYVCLSSGDHRVAGESLFCKAATSSSFSLGLKKLQAILDKECHANDTHVIELCFTSTFQKTENSQQQQKRSRFFFPNYTSREWCLLNAVQV